MGHTHAAFTGFVLPRTVYTRISRGGIEDAAECAGFVETARPLGSFVDVRRYVKDQNNLPSKAPNTMPSNQITTEITFWRLDFATARTTVLSVSSSMK